MTGPELRTWRLAHDLTQSALAAWLGVASDNTVRQWEKGLRRVPRWVEKRIEERGET